MHDTTIYETVNGRIIITATYGHLFNVTATVDGETIHFQVSVSDLWTFPREYGETTEQHWRRMVTAKAANAMPQKHLAAQETTDAD